MNEKEIYEVSILEVRKALTSIEDWCRGVREVLVYFPPDLTARVPADLLVRADHGIPTLAAGCPPPVVNENDPDCEGPKKKRRKPKAPKRP